MYPASSNAVLSGAAVHVWCTYHILGFKFRCQCAATVSSFQYGQAKKCFDMCWIKSVGKKQDPHSSSSLAKYFSWNIGLLLSL